MNFSIFRIMSVFALFAVSTTAAMAQNPWLARLTIESGGDDLVSVEFTNGDTDEIKGGGLIHLEAGKQLALVANNEALLTEFTVGYKFDSVSASNGDLRFSRFTVNAMQYYQASEKLRLGLGVTYHVNPTLDIDVPGIDGEVEVDDALGFMLGADYRFAEKVDLGLRATQIDYELANGRESSGNSVGIYATRYF